MPSNIKLFPTASADPCQHFGQWACTDGNAPDAVFNNHGPSDNYSGMAPLKSYNVVVQPKHDGAFVRALIADLQQRCGGTDSTPLCAPPPNPADVAECSRCLNCTEAPDANGFKAVATNINLDANPPKTVNATLTGQSYNASDPYEVCINVHFNDALNAAVLAANSSASTGVTSLPTSPVVAPTAKPTSAASRRSLKGYLVAGVAMLAVARALGL